MMQHDKTHQHRHEHGVMVEEAHEHVEKTEENLQEKAMHAHEHAEPHKEADHEKHTGGGHDHHAMMIVEFRKKFWISLVLSIPVIVLSPMIQHIIGYELTFPGSQYLVFAIASVIFFYGGWPFLRGMADEIKEKSVGMMTLIALAISVAYIYSTAVVFGLQGMDFYWELATLIVIMLLGHWLEMKSVAGASKALELLVNMMPSEASRIQNNNDIVKVRIEEIEKGDLILIRPGEKVPVDGFVEEGESYLNESMLTGESKPVKKVKNEKVIGGAINGNGSLKVRVENTGSESYLNKVIKLVKEAQKTKSSTQALADRAAKWLTYIALSVGIVTLAAWLMAGKEIGFAIERMVTVMVISCPHALGLAVPLVVAISTAASANNGLLIRNRTAFENARKITTIIFDKTGTLTEGSHEVAEVVSWKKSISEKELIRLAASIEQNSEHYISQGILKRVQKEKIIIPKSTKFNYLPGKGLEGLVEGKNVKVVGPNYLKEFKIQVPERKTETGVETEVYLILEGELTGYITLKDKIREDSADAIELLKKNGIKNLLLTGDNERVAESVSKTLKMDGFIANVLPHEKQEKVKEMQGKGEFVAMTGDGVNDAPALAQANVGIAVGSGTDVAAETADIILVNSNPKDIASLILFGKATYNKMVQNLLWATAYNIVAIPLAAGVLYNQGIMISPAIGAVLMSLSTIIVAVNAQFLRKSINK